MVRKLSETGVRVGRVPCAPRSARPQDRSGQVPERRGRDFFRRDRSGSLRPDGTTPENQEIRTMQPKVSQTFSDDDLILLSEGIEETLTKRRELLERFVNRKYRNAKSEEFANHGFCRRIGIMVKCIENIFEILPPNSTYVPEKENVDYAIINLQAFVNNVFGCCDNLAWIWVLENSIRSKNGNNPSPRSVGLRTKLLMENYPEALVEYINGIKPWLEYIKGYRDALAIEFHFTCLLILLIRRTRKNTMSWKMSHLRN